MNKQNDELDLDAFDEIEEMDNNPDESLLVKFLDAWENAHEPANQEAILEDYCARNPHLGGDFRDLAEARGGIDRVAFVAAREDQDPKQLGPYRILRLLAYGGMGKVYEAEDETLSRRVAVKTIRVGRAADSRLLEQFKAEREALALLHDTNIVPIFSAGEEDGLFYFAMPLINGITLADLVETMSQSESPRPEATASPTSPSSWVDLLRLAKSGASHRHTIERLTARFGVRFTRASSPPPPSSQDSLTPKPSSSPRPAEYERRVAEIVAVAAEAIHRAHEAGVLHLDVKPSNILIESASESDPLSLHPWVIDFGLVAAVEPRDGVGKDGSAGCGRQTRGFGTKGFMAPEMIVIRDDSGRETVPGPDGQSPIARETDIWSLGVTLYQLLTLRLPFSNDRRTIGPEAPVPPRRYVPDLPAELEAVVLKALQKRQGDRYATAAEFAKDLRRWLAGFPTVAGDASYQKQIVMWARRRPAAAFAAGMTAAFVIVSCLGAGQTFQKISAEASTARAEAAVAHAETRAAEQVAQANQRELDLIALARLRAPIRSGGWSENAWAKARDLVSSRPDHDGRFQGQVTTVLEGLDVHLAKSFDKPADELAFDPEGKRLLMARLGQDPEGRTVTRLVLGDLMGQQGSTEVILPNRGVIGFHDGSPVFLRWDVADPSTLHLLDAITGGEKASLKSPLNGPSTITAITLSRDGGRVAAIVWPITATTPGGGGNADPNNRPNRVGDKATLVVWNVATGGVVRSIEEKRDSQDDIVLSPDGSLVAIWDVYGPGHDVAVWAVNDGTSIGRFSTTHNPVSAVSFGRDPVWRENAKDSQWCLAVGEDGGMITVWDLHSRTVRSLARGSINDVKTLEFSRDGAWLASAGRGEFRLWDPASGECLLTAPSGNYQFGVAFSPDGHRLAVAKSPAFGFLGGVDVYDLEKGRGLRTLRGLRQRIEKVVVSLDGRRIAALSNDREVGVFEASSGALIGIAEAPRGFFTDNAALALNADGTRLVCSAGTEAKLWDVEKKQLLRAWKLPPALTEAAGFRPDGKLILIRQETKGGVVGPFRAADPKAHPRVCRAYELPEQGDPRKMAEVTDFNWYVEHIAATPNGSHFAIQGTSTATGVAVRLLHLYDGLTGERVGSIPTTMPPNDLATIMRFDPKGTRLRVRRDLRDPERVDLFEIPSLKVTGSVTHVATFNVGGSRWVSSLPQSDGVPETLVLREQGRDAPLVRIVRDVRLSGAEGIKFSPDGNFIVWGNQDGTITVCDLNEVQRRLAGIGLGW